MELGALGPQSWNKQSRGEGGRERSCREDGRRRPAPIPSSCVRLCVRRVGQLLSSQEVGAPGEGRPLPFYSSSRLYSGSRGLMGLRSPNSHPVREAIQASWRGQQHRLQKGNGTLCQGSLNGCERVCVCQREIERKYV